MRGYNLFYTSQEASHSLMISYAILLKHPQGIIPKSMRIWKPPFLNACEIQIFKNFFIFPSNDSMEIDL